MLRTYERSGLLTFRRAKTRLARSRRRLTNSEEWKREEHWTAVMTHLAGLHVYNEG
ncbi:MAG TPA: hypothetical protein VMN76_09625 [Acidobacteriota bacterium]|nr:hypothetical protein [Acidobacteriota bacterium]